MIKNKDPKINHNFELEIKSILNEKFQLNDMQIFKWINDIFYLLKKYNLELRDEFTDFELASISVDGVITQLSGKKNYFDFMKEILI